ncbi:MAG: DNA helicase RecQ [Bacteroidales bacterium]|nr:DNA helicase RecQ [Bacteroidales bacterium]MCF8338245.1 DNA helicase RecQ [Bacteroidales bacterium]
MEQADTSQKVLKKYFGHDRFRPLQSEIIQAVQDKKDTLVVMPTGGGKSVCYQVPALMNEGLTIVVSPLISLMKDQVEALKLNGIPAAFLNSSLTPVQQDKVEQSVKDNKLKLLYLSPERLLHPYMLKFIQQIPVQLFAIDEAHCISTWGHDFRPVYTELKTLKQEFPRVPLIALTATADKITRKDIIKQLTLKEPEVFVDSFDRPNLSFTVRPAIDRFKYISKFLQNRPNQSGIIYCLSRKTTESLAGRLNQAGIRAAHYHAGLSADERSRRQEAFLKDEVPVICATIAFGMGIDKSNVRWVIHYNLPKNIESYYQEIGRAGRDGLASETILFYSYNDVAILRGFIQESEFRDIKMAKLERMQQYAEAKTCRRKVLLSYFNENYPENCGNCDVCQDPPKYFEGTKVAQKALSAVARLKEGVAAGMLVDILRGSRRREILENNYHQIKTFGAGSDISYRDWQDYLMQLIHQGLLEIAYDDHHKLKLTDQSNKVLFENQPVKLTKPVNASDQKEMRKPKTKKERLQDELFELLKEKRLEIARRENAPAYAVFSDATLHQMAGRRPDNQSELLSIDGVGEQKARNYGPAFLNTIMEFKITAGDKGSTYLVTYDLLRKGYTKDQIAQNRGINPSTINSHIAHLYEKGLDVNILDFITEAELNRIKKAIEAIGTHNGLKALFLWLNEEIPYDKIRLGLAWYHKHN